MEFCYNVEVDSFVFNRKLFFRRFIFSDELRERFRFFLVREEIVLKFEDRILLKSMDFSSKLKIFIFYILGLSVFRELWNLVGNR